jgi:hypothetical protein
MLFSTTTLLLALAPAALLAAPTTNAHLGKRQLSDTDREMLLNGNCDMTFATMPTGKPSQPLLFTHSHKALD